MKEPIENHKPNQENLTTYLEKNIIKNVKKLKGKRSPLTETVDKMSKTLSIISVLNLVTESKDLYLVKVKNYSKEPRIRYFLAVMLAAQSSDLLVQLAKKYANKNDLKLIQYSLYPKLQRINLLSLKELKNVEDFSNSIQILLDFKKQFRLSLEKIKNLIEDK